MVADYRPTVLKPGTPTLNGVDPEKAVAKLENERKQQAESLRKIRLDYVNGKIAGADLARIENQFAQKLAQQRQVLQNLT